jgi:hypothetical protein
MRTKIRLLVAVAALIGAAVPASATEYVPVLNPQSVYAQCGADKLVANKAVSYTLSTTAPTGSFPQAGCGSVDGFNTNGDGMSWSGTHTGNLDELTVRAFVVDTGPVRAGAFDSIYANISLTVDDVPLAAATDFHLVPVGDATSPVRLLTFSVDGIGLLDETEAGEHKIVLDIHSSPYVDGDTVTWVVGAGDAASGINFSPSTLASATILVEQF